MTTNVLVATTHVLDGKRIRIETFDPKLPEAERTYRHIADLDSNQCNMDYAACLHDFQAMRLTEVDADSGVEVAADGSSVERPSVTITEG